MAYLSTPRFPVASGARATHNGISSSYIEEEAIAMPNAFADDADAGDPDRLRTRPIQGGAK
jgi:hypothetical protein